MDPAQTASEAVKRFAAIHTARIQGGPAEPRDLREPGAEALLEVFAQLGVLDGWAKIATARMAADPQDARAGQELCRSIEHTIRLHPHFARRLADVLSDRPAVRTALSSTLPPAQPAAVRTPEHQS